MKTAHSLFLVFLTTTVVKAQPEPITQYSGLVTNPSGPLPGAVITFSNGEVVSTNSEGEFTSSELEAEEDSLWCTISYAGYEPDTVLFSRRYPTASVELTRLDKLSLRVKEQVKGYPKADRSHNRQTLRHLRRESAIKPRFPQEP